MEKSPSTAAVTVEVAAAEGYVGWEEVYVCGEKGRREIHYYLKKRDGGSDLAVIGKEKSLRHFSYRFQLDLAPSSFSLVKLRSRREVIDWLHSFVPAAESSTPVSPQTSDVSIDGVDLEDFDVEMMKDTQLRKLGHFPKEFLWVGSPWTCKKRRKHYQAFSRNGIKIWVNQFVYVLAEEDKRLVAYLDDMYEDAKGNKMVVVRWFHNIDEVGIDLPQDFSDREIFFSLCLQDLSVECIDGLALVLSPQHYTKFLKEAKNTGLEPYVCYRQYDNEDLKPLDITQVKGYWKQEMLRYMFSRPSSGSSGKRCEPDGSQKKGDIGGISGTRPRKRLSLSRDYKIDLQCTTENNTMDADDSNAQSNTKYLGQGGNAITKSGAMQSPVAAASRKEVHMEGIQCTTVGSLVEVLSQDSGMRGCWFRAVIIKKSKNKVKLRYHDIKDADNEANCLEEWVLASRIAVDDEMGLRMHGRTTIRPAMVARNGKVSWVINVGTIVDVWWHDGWWEGIAIQKDSNDKLQVYFPGEKREAVFCRSDLRHSQEWMGGAWKELNERPDVAASILSDQMKERAAEKSENDMPPQTIASTYKHLDHDMGEDHARPVIQDCSANLETDPPYNDANSSSVVDLSKDNTLSRLKWNSSRKRKRTMPSFQKLQPNSINSVKTRKSQEHHQDFVIPSTLKIEKDSCKSSKADLDKCKYMGESLFGSSAVPALTSLVMSR